MGYEVWGMRYGVWGMGDEGRGAGTWHKDRRSTHLELNTNSTLNPQQPVLSEVEGLNPFKAKL